MGDLMEVIQTEKIVEMTPNAIVKVKEIMKTEGKDNHALRIKIFPGGCAGFMYDFSFEKVSANEDKTIIIDGLKIFIDYNTLQFLKGSTIDYLETLHGSGFNVTNPNFTHSCGCGKSHG